MDNKFELNEKKLKALFDYQRFEKNERLAKLIGKTESRYGQQLSDDELGMVNAAGEFTMPGGSNMPKETQVGGLVGNHEKGGTVSGYNIGRITGDFISNYPENNESK